MKAIFIGCWALLLVLVGCTGSKAAGSPLLSPLGGKDDNRLIEQIRSRHPGTLCALVGKDGLARLISYGHEAVVDTGGVSALLSYHPEKDGDAVFSGATASVSGKLVREQVTKPLQVVSRSVTARVRIGNGSAEIDGDWTCQAGLVDVRTNP